MLKLYLNDSNKDIIPINGQISPYNIALSRFKEGNFRLLYNPTTINEILPSFNSILNKYYITKKPSYLSQENNKLIVSIKRNGYSRASSNKHNFKALINDKVQYLKVVHYNLKKIEQSYPLRIGLHCLSLTNKNSLEEFFAAAIYLQNNILNANNIREFITAAVLTGYIFNYNPSLNMKPNIRPIDHYDIVRFYLQFKTMLYYNIEFNELLTIRSSKKDGIIVGDSEIKLPIINSKQLPLTEAMNMLNNTYLKEYFSITNKLKLDATPTNEKRIINKFQDKPLKIKISSLTSFKEKLTPINSRVEALTYTNNGRARVSLQCLDCTHNWSQRTDHFLRKPFCPKCKNIYTN